MTEPVNIASLRSEFPVMENMLYLDSAHQTPLATSVRAALSRFLAEANETAGPKPVWMKRVETSREGVAKLLNALPGEIAFTKNTSESLNIAANAVPLAPGENVLLIEGDHPNNAYAWLNLKRKGIEVRFAKLGDRPASAATFAPYVDSKTRVISLSHVTFHAGHRHDVADIGRLCAGGGIYLVVDAMQSVGVLPVDVKELGVSVLAAGCHKGLLAPHGLGILYVKDGLSELQPTYLAMSSLAHPPDDYIARPEHLATRYDAKRFEMGNFNLSHLHALSTSLELINGVGVANIEQHVLSLGDRLISHLDHLGIRLVGPRARAHRAHIYVLDVPVNEWAEYLEQQNVRCSPERDGIRISFGVFNSFEDVDRLAAILSRRLGRELDARAA